MQKRSGYKYASLRSLITLIAVIKEASSNAWKIHENRIIDFTVKVKQYTKEIHFY